MWLCSQRHISNPLRGSVFQIFHFYRTYHFLGRKGGTAIAVKKGISHNHVDLLSLASTESTATIEATCS
jgi:hypothetical protein